MVDDGSPEEGMFACKTTVAKQKLRRICCIPFPVPLVGSHGGLENGTPKSLDTGSAPHHKLRHAPELPDLSPLHKARARPRPNIA